MSSPNSPENTPSGADLEAQTNHSSPPAEVDTPSADGQNSLETEGNPNESLSNPPAPEDEHDDVESSLAGSILRPIVEEWKADMVADGDVHPSRTYPTYMHRFCDWLDKKGVGWDDVPPDAPDQYSADQKLKPGTHNGLRTALNRFFAWAQDRGVELPSMSVPATKKLGPRKKKETPVSSPQTAAYRRDPLSAKMPAGGTLKVWIVSQGQDGTPPGKLIAIGKYNATDVDRYSSIETFIDSALHQTYGSGNSQATTYVYQHLDSNGKAVSEQREYIVAPPPSWGARAQAHDPQQATQSMLQQLFDRLKSADTDNRARYDELATKTHGFVQERGNLDAPTMIWLQSQLEANKPKEVPWEQIMGELRGILSQAQAATAPMDPNLVALASTPVESPAERTLSTVVERMLDQPKSPGGPQLGEIVGLMQQTQAQTIEMMRAMQPQSGGNDAMITLLMNQVNQLQTQLMESRGDDFEKSANKMMMMMQLVEKMGGNDGSPLERLVETVVDNADKIGNAAAKVMMASKTGELKKAISLKKQRGHQVAGPPAQSTPQPTQQQIELPADLLEKIYIVRDTPDTTDEDHESAIGEAVVTLIVDLYNHEEEQWKALGNAVYNALATKVHDSNDVRTLCNAVWAKCGAKTFLSPDEYRESIDKAARVVSKHWDTIAEMFKLDVTLADAADIAQAEAEREVHEAQSALQTQGPEDEDDEDDLDEEDGFTIGDFEIVPGDDDAEDDDGSAEMAQVDDERSSPLVRIGGTQTRNGRANSTSEDRPAHGGNGRTHVEGDEGGGEEDLDEPSEPRVSRHQRAVVPRPPKASQ